MGSRRLLRGETPRLLAAAGAASGNRAARPWRWRQSQPPARSSRRSRGTAQQKRGAAPAATGPPRWPMLPEPRAEDWPEGGRIDPSRRQRRPAQDSAGWLEWGERSCCHGPSHGLEACQDRLRSEPRDRQRLKEGQAVSPVAWVGWMSWQGAPAATLAAERGCSKELRKAAPAARPSGAATPRTRQHLLRAPGGAQRAGAWAGGGGLEKSALRWW